MNSHIYQLASYCLLVEKTYGKRPPYGIIHYKDQDFAIDYTQELEFFPARSAGRNETG